MKVTPPDPSDSSGVADFVAEAVDALGEALDDGTSFADSVLEGMTRDPHVWAHLVRYRTVEVLKGLAPSETWKLGRPLRNSGIEVVCEPFLIKVFKSQGGGPPHPGGSRKRRRFWSQMDQLKLDLDGVGVVRGKTANLILDWNVDDERAVLLGLSKPGGIWNYQALPRMEWRIAVTIGEERMRFDAAEEDVHVELDVDEVEDTGSGTTGQ